MKRFMNLCKGAAYSAIAASLVSAVAVLITMIFGLALGYDLRHMWIWVGIILAFLNMIIGSTYTMLLTSETYGRACDEALYAAQDTVKDAEESESESSEKEETNE